MTGKSRPTRRTQAQRRADAESSLLRAAAELIAERGIERTSLRGIGERAGTSRAMPAYHFGSKDGLIARLVERGHEQTVSQVGEDLDAGPRLPALRATIETFLDVFAAPETPEERAVVVMWGATFPTEAPLAAMVESDRETHALLAALIREGQEDGSIRTDVDADAAAVLVMGLSRGVAALSLNHADAADAAAVRRLCGDAIEATLRPQAE